MHAQRRAWERYGLAIDRGLYRHLIKIIQAGNSTFLQKQTNRVSVHEVLYQDVTYRVVYDKSRKTIVTFLPPVDPVDKDPGGGFPGFQKVDFSQKF